MIKLENTEVSGWQAAIRGMRNPMNSWDKSDSDVCEGRSGRCDTCWLKPEDDYAPCYSATERKGTLYVVGEQDLDLMKKLVQAGSDHSKFMRMINVTVDITAPLYWWKEFDTYKVGTVRNSCSTMHKIHAKEFELDDFSHEHLIDSQESWLGMLEVTLIEALNCARKLYLETKDKTYWWQMIQLLPSSYNQRATVQVTYAMLRNAYHSRKNHKLDCWHTFCHWIESLPYSELITL